MKQYEIIYIANPDLDDQSITDLNNKVAGWITESGGEVEKIDDWGKRRLAYRIQKQRDGHYVLINAKLDQDDIDKSKDQEQTTSTSIADLEVQISQLSADRDTAQISAQSANEDYLQALDELDTATTEVKTAEQNAVDVAAATETARRRC